MDDSFILNFIQNAEFKPVVKTKVTERYLAALRMFMKFVEYEHQLFVFIQFTFDGG